MTETINEDDNVASGPKKLPRAKRDKSSKLNSAYVDPQKFFEEIRDYYYARQEAIAAGRPIPRMNNYIGKCFILIAENLARSGNFAGYTYKDEMISDAIINCVKYAGNFNPEKSTNPFSYFTQICWNTFLGRLRLEKIQRYVKAKMVVAAPLEDMFQHANFEDTDSIPDDFQPSAIFHADNINDFIRDFEEKNKIKPRKKNEPNPLEALFS